MISNAVSQGGIMTNRSQSQHNMRDELGQASSRVNAGVQGGFFKPKSLNIAIRRRDNERIERENHAFARRLFTNEGSINKRQMD